MVFRARWTFPISSGRGQFSVLSDPEFFGQVSIGSGGEITWEDTADICADAVYFNITGKRPEDLFPGLKN